MLLLKIIFYIIQQNEEIETNFLFLDSDTEFNTLTSLDTLFILLRDEGWEAAVNVLRNQYDACTWSRLTLDLLAGLVASLKCVAGNAKVDR